MTASTHTPERRHPEASHTFTRGRFRRFWDVLFKGLRWVARHVHNAYATFGLFLLIGATLAIAGTWGFAQLARHVSAGKTQSFDEAFLQWIGSHRADTVTAVMLDITALGTSSVVMMIVAIAALFLWLNQHRQSALLLIFTTFGGIILNNLLKLGFARPRPDVITWVTQAKLSSFPSGHAMSATIVYGTVAYLAARLQRTHASRVAVMATALVVIFLIAISRLYLGVHYPSDVLAGIVVGIAWVGFCMAALEAVQLYARRNAPELLRTEHPTPRDQSDAEPADTV